VQGASGRAAGDHPAVIDDVSGGDPLVQRGQRRRGRDGDQVEAGTHGLSTVTGPGTRGFTCAAGGAARTWG